MTSEDYRMALAQERHDEDLEARNGLHLVHIVRAPRGLTAADCDVCGPIFAGTYVAALDAADEHGEVAR